MNYESCCIHKDQKLRRCGDSAPLFFGELMCFCERNWGFKRVRRLKELGVRS